MSEPVEGEIVNQAPPVRLTKHDENIVLLLESAFNNLYNITEACRYAGISRETYYEWLRDDDIFSYRMSIAQGAPLRSSKSNIIKAVDEGDVATSKWLLERKDPEFKPKAEVSTTPEQIETRDKLKEVLNAIAEHDPSSQPAIPPVARNDDVVAGSPTDIS